MNGMWLNIVSIVFGLFAWGLSLVAITKFRNDKEMQGTYRLYGSLFCVIISLLGVILYRNYLLHIEDWSALLDTAGGFWFASVVLVVVTIGLNSVALMFGIKRRKKKT